MFFTETIDIKRKTITDLGGGSRSEDYTTVQTGVPASIQFKSLEDIIRAGRKINSTAFTCYTASTEDIQGDDKIVFNGEDYAILSLQPDPNGIYGYQKIFGEKII